MLGQHLHLGHLLHPFPRQLYRSIVIPSRLLHVYGEIAVAVAHIVRLLTFTEPITDAFVGETRMDHGGQECHLLGPAFGSLGRQLRPFIPSQQGGDAFELANFFQM